MAAKSKQTAIAHAFLWEKSDSLTLFLKQGRYILSSLGKGQFVCGNKACDEIKKLRKAVLLFFIAEVVKFAVTNRGYSLLLFKHYCVL